MTGRPGQTRPLAKEKEIEKNIWLAEEKEKEGNIWSWKNIWLAEEIKQRSLKCLLLSDIGYCGGFICSSCGEETIQDKPPITSAV